MSIRLAIVDDDQTLAKMLRQELMTFDEIGPVHLASSGLGFVRSLDDSGEPLPEVVLMDISMELVDEGLQATRLLHECHPEIKVIMFTVAEDDSNVFEAFKSGAVGYLVKNERLAFIHQTIMDVYHGGALMSPGIALKAIHFLSAASNTKNKISGAPYELTEREQEVLRLVAKGYTYEFMANNMFISMETVKKHMSNIFKKLQVKNKIEAINKSREWL